jgi:hypothetical protein
MSFPCEGFFCNANIIECYSKFDYIWTNQYLQMKSLLLLGFLCFTIPSFSQCEIYNSIASDGTLLYYMEPKVLFWSSTKELQGNVVADETNYYLGFQPSPFPAKNSGVEFKEHMEVTLTNKKTYLLKLYEAKYLDDESILQFLFLINKDDLPDFVKYQVIDMTIYMGKEEGIRSYSFNLNRTTLQDQLNCFLKEKNK